VEARKWGRRRVVLAVAVTAAEGSTTREAGGREGERTVAAAAATEGERGRGVPRVAAARRWTRGLLSGSGMNREAKRVISREVCIARICLRALLFFSSFPLDFPPLLHHPRRA